MYLCLFLFYVVGVGGSVVFMFVWWRVGVKLMSVNSVFQDFFYVQAVCGN